MLTNSTKAFGRRTLGRRLALIGCAVGKIVAMPGSIRCLLMPWFLASPGHQHAWYWSSFLSLKDHRCVGSHRRAPGGKMWSSLILWFLSSQPMASDCLLGRCSLVTYATVRPGTASIHWDNGYSSAPLQSNVKSKPMLFCPKLDVRITKFTWNYVIFRCFNFWEYSWNNHLQGSQQLAVMRV